MNYYYNNASVAQLGHGKWKRALGHTLLLIGFLMGFGMMSAYAQTLTPVPAGLKMEKTWVSDDPTNRTGNIFMEVFVTGEVITSHKPTDIVLVLDVSGSMTDNISSYVYTPRASQAYTYNNYGNSTYYYLHTDGNYYAVSSYRYNAGSWLNPRYQYRLRFQVGNTYYYLSDTYGVTTNAPTDVTDANGTIWTGVLYTRSTVTQSKMAALQAAVCSFVDNIAEDANHFDVDHRISVVKYAIDEYYRPEEYQGTDQGESYLGEGNHRGAVGSSGASASYNYNYTEVVMNRRSAKTDAAALKTAVNGLVASGATAADFGMKKAQYVLAQIDPTDDRTKVVVMFTDGDPTYQSNFSTTVANNTIENAYTLKHNGTINGTNVNFDAKVYTIGVFSNPSNNTLNYMSYTSSNYLNAHSMNNHGNATPNANYFYTAESVDDLNSIFENIAGESGAMALPASTIVQDVVSPNFQLPEGSTGTVFAYAPLCTDYNEETGKYTFESINDAGTLIVNTQTGVVTGGTENKLPSTFVDVNETTKTIQMSGFNFSEHWCGWEVDPLGNKTIHGRKIVIVIPVEVEEGMWGDGIETNDPDHAYVKVGDIYYGPFNNLTTNVMGDVWTEVITSEPAGYSDDNIDSPEDLAWFISRVNGRIHYNGETNNVASNTSLNGTLTADIDMSAHNWVPIGAGYKCNANNQYVDAAGNVVSQPTVKLAYEGVFDGNGHVVTGLKNNADKWYKTAAGQQNEVVVFPGMFSNVKGNGTTTGIVHDVFILDSDFRGKYHGGDYEGKFIHHGILADTLTGGAIYNCEAAGNMTCNNDAPGDVNLIYGGLVGLNRGGTIYNSMAMANLKCYTMGGAVGENRTDEQNNKTASLSNSFTNGEYHYIVKSGVEAKPVGGLAAINTGTIENCYVRFERLNENLDQAAFDMLVSDGTSSNCYIPQLLTWSRPDIESATEQINTNTTVPLDENITTPAGNPANSYTLAVDPSYYNMFTNDNMTGGSWGTLGSYNVYKNGTPLFEQLNTNGNDHTNWAEWKRTTAGRYTVTTNYVSGDINDDFPVLQLPGYTCLGSADGIRIDYAHNLNDMLHRHNNGNMNENTQISNAYSANNTNDFYKVTGHEAIYKGAINLYANDDVTLPEPEEPSGKDGEVEVADNCTAEGVVVYIDEKVSLLQDDDSEIEAYTGQTLKAFGNTEPQAGDRWHNISSSLKNSQFGWSYGNNEEVEHNFESDPCGWTLQTYDEDYAFFPIDLNSYHRADFYCFFEPEYHWVNFRRNGQSHWHMDDYTAKINYYYNQPNEAGTEFTQVEDNEDQFLPGKGYLVTVDMSQWWNFNAGGLQVSKQAQFMQNRGTLNSGDVLIPVTCTDGIEWSGRQGYNLLGNPYQSYLDFEEFVGGNPELWGTDDQFAQTYAVYDPQYSKYIQYKANSSKGSLTADQFINMHQGFFIKTSQTTTATFTNAMRSNEGTPNFRGEKPAFPLINFIVTDDEGNTDLAIIELNRAQNEGATKLRMGSSKGRIYFRYEKENLAIFFRDNAKDNQILNFVAEENGNYTLSWNTANADFNSLTLIDNITGVKTDMLAHDQYTFEGSPEDYETRFKIVFDLNNFNEDEIEESETFAFFNEGNLIVNGEGYFDVIDVLGRVVYAAQLTDTQNTVSLPHNLSGVCLLRISNGDKVKVQKMYVR